MFLATAKIASMTCEKYISMDVETSGNVILQWRTNHSLSNGLKMPSSGMLPCVVLMTTDVSEESIASILRVTRIGELGTI
jgi:hypothetical protein